MLVELKAKSQVTIPKEIVSLMNLNQGDKFEIIEESGRIVLIPLEVYPKNTIASSTMRWTLAYRRPSFKISKMARITRQTLIWRGFNAFF